jgi:DNA-directed RNA polymerase specialized sigma24 family protein
VHTRMAPHRGTAADAVHVGLDFEVFYRRAYDDVARALVLTLQDRQVGLEAADEAMLRAYQRWDAISGYADPAGWAYRVGLNWATSLRRRLVRLVPLGRAEGAAPEVEVPDPLVARALADLDVKHRAVVVCRLWLDLDTAQTAAALKIPAGTVKSRMSRALAKLETMVEDPR